MQDSVVYFSYCGILSTFMLWDSVLWDFVRRDFVLWDFVLWDSVLDSSETGHGMRRNSATMGRRRQATVKAW